MKSAKTIGLLLLCACAASAGFGEEFWAKKPYQKWTPEETNKLLTDSPWAKTVTIATAIDPTDHHNGGMPFALGDSPEGEPAPSITYTMQIRSATPIREAMVRSSEIAGHYDSLASSAKVNYDNSAAKFLSATFPDRVLVCVTVKANTPGYESRLRSYWSQQSAAKLSMTTFLNVGRQKLSPIGYSFKDDVIQFVFPRPNSLATEDFSVEFMHPTIEALFSQRMLINFKPRKMEIDGQPAL